MTNKNDGSNQKPQALVVGINKYRKFVNLQVPAVNAEYMANRLKEQGNFEVELLDDYVTRKELKEHIVKLFKANGSNSKVALLYLSGYVLVKQGIEEVFLATSDSNPVEDYELGVSLRWLKKLLQDSPVEQQIVILDCCGYKGEIADSNNLIPEYQSRKDRFFLILFHQTNQEFLQKNNLCSSLTNAILNILHQDGNNYCIDSKTLIQRLKEQYEKQLKKCGVYKRIYFGTRIDILGEPSDTDDKRIITSSNNTNDSKNPYKGLASFESEDGDYFYGREKLTNELLVKLRENNFLAVMGASGSGKSSVIKAGLIYQLKLGEQISESDSWVIATFQPGTDPLQSLAESLAEILEKEILIDTRRDSDDNIQNKIAEVRKKYIDKGADGLAELIHDSRATRVVLVIDQFEEIFTLCEDNEKQQFLNCILGALEQVDSIKLSLVIALRADFFGKCAEQEYRAFNKQEKKFEQKGLARKIQQNLVAVTPMVKEELEQAIVKPAREQGVKKVDAKLINKLVNDVLREPGSLPLLQYALEQIWEESKKDWNPPNEKALKDDKYRPLKKVLEEYANKVYDSLEETEKLIAKYIFLKLTYLGSGTGNTRKKIFQDQLIETERYNEEQINQVKKELAKKDLIIVDTEIKDGKEDEVINLVHDALIRHWSKLRKWLEDYRYYKKLKEDIEDDAKTWDSKKRSEDYLYFGEKLKDAEKFIEDYGDILTLKKLAKELIKESQLSREKEERIAREKEEKIAREEQEKIARKEQEKIARKKQEKIAREEQEKKISDNRIKIITIFTSALILLFAVVYGVQKHNSEIIITNQNKQLSKQSVALTRYSKTLFNENQKFDALIEGLRATIPLKKREIPFPKNIKPVPVLRQAIEGVKERNRLEAHEGTIYDISFSPDGRTLVSGGLDNTIKLWDFETGKEKTKNSPLKKHKGKVYNVTFNPKDKNQLASSSADGTIRLWNFKKGDYQELTGHKGKVYSLSYTNDGQILASSSFDKTIRLWNPQTGKEIRSPLTGHKNKVYSINFNPQNPKQLVSGSVDGTVRLWDIKTGESRILSKRNYNVDSVHFSPDGKKLASGSADGTVHIWNCETSEEFNIHQICDFKNVKEFNTRNKHNFSAMSVIFSPDSKMLASSSLDNTIKLWDVATGKEITTITGHKDWVYDVSFHPKDKTKLASSSADGTIRLWDIKKIQSITTLIGHQNWVNRVIFNPQDNTQLASASVDGSIKLWNVNTGKKSELPTKMHKRINSLSFSSDGKILASSNADGSIQLWDTQTRKEIKPSSGERLAGHENWVNSVSFNPQDDTELASASNDETIKVWNIKTGKLIYPALRGRSEFSTIRFSFDGKTLAAASFDNTIKLWDAKTGKEKSISPLIGHQNKVSSISFSHDKKQLASGSFDNTVKVWNLDSGKVIHTFKGHTGKVESVSFSPNGKILASGSADKTIKLWDISRGKEIKTFAGHNNDVLTLSFNSDRDNPVLASGSADEKIILWKIPNEKEIENAENKDLNDLIIEGCNWTHYYLENNSNVPDNDKHLCDNIDSTSTFEINGLDNSLMQQFVWNQLLIAKKIIFQTLNLLVQNRLT